MYSALDLKLGFAILRCKEGLDFSKVIASEQQIIREVPADTVDPDESGPVPAKKTRKISTAVYRYGHYPVL